MLESRFHADSGLSGSRLGIAIDERRLRVASKSMTLFSREKERFFSAKCPFLAAFASLLCLIVRSTILARPHSRLGADPESFAGRL